MTDQKYVMIGFLYVSRNFLHPFITFWFIWRWHRQSASVYINFIKFSHKPRFPSTIRIASESMYDKDFFHISIIADS